MCCEEHVREEVVKNNTGEGDDLSMFRSDFESLEHASEDLDHQAEGVLCHSSNSEDLAVKAVLLL